MGRRALAALALIVGASAWASVPAGAAGGRLAPVDERYEPGEPAMLVGYTTGPAPESPFLAFLRAAGTVPRARVLETDWYVGELAVEETAHPGALRLRVSLRFEVPPGLEPGQYELVYCDDPCTGAPLGDLGTSPLSVGVDPVRPVVREWALDEPERSHLAPDAVVLPAPSPVPAAVAPAVTATPVTPVTVTVPPVTVTVPVPAGDEMDWELPTALVLGAAAATWVMLARRQRGARPPATATASPAAGDRRPHAAAAGPG